MSHQIYRIRNYQPEDNQGLRKLKSEVTGESKIFCGPSIEELLRNLYRPNHFPAKDFFVAEKAGAIIGYIDVMAELIIKRAILNCMIYPGHQKILGKLAHHAIDRAEDLNLDRTHINIPEADTGTRKLLSNMGFRCVRRFIEMTINIEERPFQEEDPRRLYFRTLKRGEEHILTEIQNRSFMGTWGFNPNTLEETLYRINLPDTSAEDVILCLEGERPIAYCWTVKCQEGKKKTMGDRARIHMLGVDPEFRARGAGEAVLQAGLSLLKRRDFSTVVLTVDSENTIASSLYRKAGFETCSRSLWYEKKLGQSC